MRPLLVICALIALVGAACEPPPPEPSDAVLVGDSILTLSAEEVNATLPTGGWTSFVDARNATGLTQLPGETDWFAWAARIQELVRVRKPEALVIVLGTNDTLNMPERGPYSVHVDRVMSKIAAGAEAASYEGPLVLWLNPSSHTAVIERNLGATQISDEIRIQTAQYPNLTWVDWDSEVAADIECFNGPDSVHPGPLGQQATADLILRELNNV